MPPGPETRFLQRWAQRLHERNSETEHARAELARSVNIAVARAGLGDPPRDLARLASTLGVVDVNDLPLPMNGRLMRSPAGWIIELNSDLDSGVRPFVLAHELAHLIVDSPSLTDHGSVNGGTYPDGTAYEANERRCDDAALEILLPRSWLIDGADSSRPLLLEAVRMSEALSIAIEVVATALAATNLWDGQLSIWRRGSDEWVPDPKHTHFRPLPFSAVPAWGGIMELEPGEVAIGSLELQTGDGGARDYRTESLRLDNSRILAFLG